MIHCLEMEKILACLRLAGMVVYAAIISIYGHVIAHQKSNVIYFNQGNKLLIIFLNNLFKDMEEIVDH